MSEITLKLKVEVVDGVVRTEIEEARPETLPPLPHILLVCQNADAAKLQAHELRRAGRKDVFVTHPGNSLIGRRFDTIIRPAYFSGSQGLRDAGAAAQRQEAWWRDQALTRLTQDGVVLSV